MTPPVPRRGALATAALACVAACSGGAPRPATGLVDKPTRDDESRLARMYSELQDDIFTSYERDEPPDIATGMIDPRIGAARIGVRPGDVYTAGDLARASSSWSGRWPIEVDRSIRSEVWSKHLEIQISLDQTAAWMSDEMSWRIQTCDRTAVIPLRITALYAHDGDRWVPIVEHLSFGFAPVPDDARPPGDAPRAIKTEVASGDLRDELSGVLARGVFRAPHDPAVAAQAGAMVLGPDIADEWHGPRVLEARLPAGTLEDRRVGLVGRNPRTATIASWVGTYIASLPAGPRSPAGKARMRVTHVFEKRWFESRDGLPVEGKSCQLEDKDVKDSTTRAREVAAHCRWMVVQSHMSQPITEPDLSQRVFGSALISARPLQFDCSDAARPAAPATAPGAGPRPAATPPRAGTP
jgi:hypothetical protein